ncbi:MAG: FecR family protein [Candidatus Acidiferrales bacterium]
MRFVCKGILACVLSVSLIGLPVFAAPTPNRPLGFVLATQDAVLDGNSAANGANIYNGDVVATGANGSLHLQFAANQIYFSPSSTATLNTNGPGVTALLQSGTAGFTSARGGSVAIRALDVLVHPQTAQPTTAQVTVMAPDELKVASVAGPLSLELDGETYSLTPGRTYGVKIVTDGKFQEGYVGARRRRGLIIFVFAATAGLAGITYLVHELNESPSSP